MNDIQDAMFELTGGRSVPRVFIDGNLLLFKMFYNS